jgi:hypothetical protein
MSNENVYGDGIKLDNGRFVRLSKLPLDEVITLRGRKIKVADIPLVAARLKCSCLIRGIAVELRDVIFCDEHHVESFVIEVIK